MSNNAKQVAIIRRYKTSAGSCFCFATLTGNSVAVLLTRSLLYWAFHSVLFSGQGVCAVLCIEHFSNLCPFTRLKTQVACLFSNLPSGGLIREQNGIGTNSNLVDNQSEKYII